MTNIRIQPKDVWAYFESLGSPVGVSIPIAINDDIGARVYINATEDEDYPIISATIDGELIYELVVADAEECESTVEEVIDEFLNEKSDISPEELKQEEDIEEEREAELTDAVYDFLNVALLDISRVDDSVFQDCLEHFLKYIHLKHKLPIYRPMTIEYSDGTESFEEYPYEHLDFDDSYSMVYK